eukprot:3271622-Amphidinium_carterae.1
MVRASGGGLGKSPTDGNMTPGIGRVVVLGSYRPNRSTSSRSSVAAERNTSLREPTLQSNGNLLPSIQTPPLLEISRCS